jgi:hypothetical protein
MAVCRLSLKTDLSHVNGLAVVGCELGGVRLVEHLEKGNSVLRKGSFDGSELPSEKADRAWLLGAVLRSGEITDISEVWGLSEE